MDYSVQLVGSNLEARQTVYNTVVEYARAKNLTVLVCNNHGYTGDFHNLAAYAADLEIKMWSVPESFKVRQGTMATVYGVALHEHNLYEMTDCFIIDEPVPDNFHVIKDRDDQILAIYESSLGCRNVLHVLFDLPHAPHGKDEIARHFLTRILDALPDIQRLTPEVKILNSLKKAKVALLRELEEHIDSTRESLDELTDSITKQEVKLETLKTELSSFSILPDLMLADVSEFITKVKALHQVYSVSLGSGGIHVTTQFLTFKFNDSFRILGRVQFIITWSGKVEFIHKRKYGPSVHPHVNAEGNACWPNSPGGIPLSLTLKTLILRAQGGEAVQFLIRGFLQQINVGDTYYPPTKWAVADPTKVDEMGVIHFVNNEEGDTE